MANPETSGTDPKEPEASSPRRLAPRDRVCLFAGFAVLFLLYLSDGNVLPGNDAKANAYLPIALLETGSFSFSPERFPFMFEWRARAGDAHRDLSFSDWEGPAAGTTLRDLYERGGLEVRSQKYYLVPGVREGQYLNTFGPGAGLAALPVFAIFALTSDGFAQDPVRILQAGKVVASLMVAGSAVFVFLTCIELTTRRRALLIASVYALGTCVWSTASQTLWQHGPSLFCVSLGLMFLFRRSDSTDDTTLAGLALGAAVVCRPTNVLIVAIFALAFLVNDRRRLLAFATGAAPMGFFLMAYNMHYLGSPFVVAQSLVAPAIAEAKLGTSNPWDTSLFEGATGLLFSPSRGLFIFSPVLIFALPGIIRSWHHPRKALFRPLAIALLALLLLGFKWLDWWGGWSFGYRHIVDTMPLWVLFMVPAFDLFDSRMRAGSPGRTLLVSFASLLFAWSVAVQGIGAFAYDVVGWDAKMVGATVMDIDDPKYRARLWSVSDSPLVYYLHNFSEARKNRQMLTTRWSESPRF